MTIQPIASQPVTAAGEASQASAVRTPSQSMDANVFMSLLVTQLKKRAVSVSAAATALTKGVVSACA